MRTRVLAAMAAVVVLLSACSGDPLDEFRDATRTVQASWDELDCTSMKALDAGGGCDGVMLGMASAAASITQARDADGVAIPDEVYGPADEVVTQWVAYGDAAAVDTGAIAFDLVNAWDKLVDALD